MLNDIFSVLIQSRSVTKEKWKCIYISAMALWALYAEGTQQGYMDENCEI